MSGTVVRVRAALVPLPSKDGTGNFDFNAATEGYGDLARMGVIDPARVTRLALQNAVSVAGLLLTTEAAAASVEEPR